MDRAKFVYSLQDIPCAQWIWTGWSQTPGEINTTAALVRGVAARFVQLGCPVAGFDAYVTSTVLPGSGLSSSAAFEVLLGTVLNCLFFERKLTAPEIAMAGQYGENVFSGKPSGLMDQMACAVGNLVAIDFLDPGKPAIHPVAFDFAACGHALCIVDSRASHADLTDEYTAITHELKALCSYFGKDVLSQVPESNFTLPFPPYAPVWGTGQFCGPFTSTRRISGCPSRWPHWRPEILTSSYTW